LGRNWFVGVVFLLAFSAFAADKPIAKLTLESPKLVEGQPIPVQFTEDSKNLSPPIQWKDLPKGTRQLALICDDPDAPTAEPFVHWVIYNIPGDAKELPEGLPRDATLKAPKDLVGAMQGKNGWGQAGYHGPAPPKGKIHHYHFKLYALDTALILNPGLEKKGLLKGIEGHVLAQGEIVVTYQR